MIFDIRTHAPRYVNNPLMQRSSYLSNEMATRVKTEAETDTFAMKLFIVQYLRVEVNAIQQMNVRALMQCYIYEY